MKCVSILTNKVKGQNISFPCGKCMNCQANKVTDYTVRHELEWRYAKSGMFITLTYQDLKLPVSTFMDETQNEDYQPSISKEDYQKFVKLLRYYNDKCYEIEHPIKTKTVNGFVFQIPQKKEYELTYSGIADYGEKTYRPHMHFLVFNHHPRLAKQLLKAWKKGGVNIKQISSHYIRYMARHQIKGVKLKLKNGQENTFRSSSKKGIGIEYANRNKERHLKTKTTIIAVQGKEYEMPLFLYRKIFGEKTIRTKLLKQYENQQYQKEWESENEADYSTYTRIADTKKLKHEKRNKKGVI